MLFGESLINIAIPVNILNLYPLLNETRSIAKMLGDQASKHNGTKAGQILKSLHQLGYERYRTIKTKFDTVRYFYSDPNDEQLQAESDLLHRDPDFSFNQANVEMSKFLEEHQTFAENRLALKNLLGSIGDQLMTSTTPRPSNEKRKRSTKPDTTPYPRIDPSDYIPRVEKYNSSTHERVPRQIVLGFLAAMVASIGVSSAFGLVSGQKIEHLADALSRTVHRQDLLLEQVEQDNKEISTNRHLISNLGDVTKLMGIMVEEQHWVEQGMYIFLIIQTELSKLENLLDVYIDTMQSAQANHLNVGLLTAKGVQEVYDLMVKVGSDSNLTPVINNAAQIAQLPTSWVLTKVGYKVIIHCLAASEHLTYKLLKYKSFPINIGKTSTGSPAAFGRIVPEDSILAISSDNRFVELSPYDLSLCNNLGGIRLCSGNIFNKPTKETCLSALFQADHLKAVDLCSLSLESADSDQVMEIAPNVFKYFSPTGSASYRTVCTNSDTLGQLTQFSTLTIPEGCHLETPDYYLYRRDSLNAKFDPLPSMYQWQLPVLSFFDDDLEIEDLTKAIAKLEDWKGIPKIDASTIQKLHRLDRPFYRDPPLLSTMSISGLALTMVCVLVFCICCQAYKNRKHDRRMNDPTYRYKELLKDDLNVDALVDFIQKRRENPANAVPPE